MVFSRQPHSLLHLQALVLTAFFLLYEKRLKLSRMEMGLSCICGTFRLMVVKEKIHSFVLVLVFILISCLTNYNLKHLHCLIKVFHVQIHVLYFY